MNARLIRRRRFVARHHYRRGGWTEERNRAVFRAQVEPHEHRWLVEVHVVGPIDPETGFTTDLARLDEELDAVLSGWDGADLNHVVPEVREGDELPTTESLARWIYHRLDGRLSPPAKLERVGVFESEELGAEYPA